MHLKESDTPAPMFYNLTLFNVTFEVFVAVYVDVDEIRNQPYYILVVAIVSLETILITFLILSNFTRIIIIYRSSHFHRNLQRLFMYFSLIYVISGFCRILLIGYEFQFIRITNKLPGDLPLLMSSYFRIMEMVSTGGVVPATVIERWTATYFIKDYERSNRSYVSTALLFIMFSGAFVLTLLSIFFLASNIKMTFFVLAPTYVILTFVGYMQIYTNTPLSTMRLKNRPVFRFKFAAVTALADCLHCMTKLMHWLLVKNVKFQKAITSTFDTSKYGLSTRFQLEENIRVLELSTLLMKITAIANFANCFVGTFAFAILDRKTVLAQVMMCVFDLTSAMYWLVHVVSIFLLVEPWKEDLLLIIQKIFCQCKSFAPKRPANKQLSINHATDTDAYFKMYNW